MSRDLRLYLDDILNGIRQIEEYIADIIIAHSYFSLSESVIWDIAKNKLDQLAECVEQIESQLVSETDSEEKS